MCSIHLYEWRGYPMANLPCGASTADATHDSQGVGMLSWQRGPESGMDNGVRFMFGGPTGGRGRTVHNPQAAVQGGYDSQRSFTYDFWAVDMNSYLYREKQVLAEMAAVLNNASGHAYWQASAAHLLPRLQKMFYVAAAAENDDHAFFQDRYFNGTRREG